MEAPKSQGITDNKKEQRSKTFGAGRVGGAIPGLLVFGGALAVTGLVAVASFVANRNKSKACPHKPRQSDDASLGIPSLQDSTTNHDNACYETSNTTKDQVHSCESTLILVIHLLSIFVFLPAKLYAVLVLWLWKLRLIIRRILVQEDKPDLKVQTCVDEESVTSLRQEIVLSDDSPPESTVSFNDNGIGGEGLEASADSLCFKEVNQSEPQDPLKSVEINEGKNDNDSATTETEDEIVEEDDDVAFGTSENSSEATWRTSLDSVEAAIWPAELIEEEPQRVKGKMVSDQSEDEGTAKSNICCAYDKSHSGANISEFSGYAGNDRVIASAKASSSEKLNLYVALNYHLSLSKFKTWVILLLIFAILILVVLAHRNRISGSLMVAIP